MDDLESQREGLGPTQSFGTSNENGLSWCTCRQEAWPTQGAPAGLEKAAITHSAWESANEAVPPPGNLVVMGRTSGFACLVPFSSGERSPVFVG